MLALKQISDARHGYMSQRAGLMQRLHVIQAELIPDLGREVAVLSKVDPSVKTKTSLV